MTGLQLLGSYFADVERPKRRPIYLLIKQPIYKLVGVEWR